MELCQEISIRLLGGFSVSVSGQEIPAGTWRLRKSRSLVKLLSLAPGHRLHRDKVMEQLWPDMDYREALNNLHQTLYSARHALNHFGRLCPHFLALQDEVLLLCGNGTPYIDVDAFEAAAARAASSQAAEDYQTATRFYGGDLLPEDTYEPWTEARRDSLRQLMNGMLLDEAGLHERHGDDTEAVRLYQKAIASDAGQEGAHAGLMRLYARTGQRALAIQQYKQIKDYLERELETVPDPQTTRLYEAILAGKLPVPGEREENVPAGLSQAEAGPTMPAVGHPKPLHNLPHRWVSFIGRETELEQVIDLVHHTRLVTITGPGGVGKTSLAIQAAQRLLAEFPHGAWLVELADISDDQRLVQAISVGIGAGKGSSLAGVQEILSGKRLLLILDNCEHLLDDCARLASGLLRKAPGLHILATSRERLYTPGEAVYNLPPLRFSDPAHLPPLREMAQVEAVRLFIDRARLVQPAYTLTEADASSVARICSLLDGIPLALELAAARMRILSARQIAARLDQRFQLLTSSDQADSTRHQTLRSMVDWSYRLLSEKERLLFQRLAVFAGQWNLEAAEAVCAGGGLSLEEVLVSLEQLVDKSLVVPETHPPLDPAAGANPPEEPFPVAHLPPVVAPLPVAHLPPVVAPLPVAHLPPEVAPLPVAPPPDGPRFRFLDTIRQYAREKLASERLVESGTESAIHDRHLVYFSGLTGQAVQHFRSLGAEAWLRAMDEELENLRAALAWALAHPQPERLALGLKMAADLHWYWHIRSMFLEGIEWLEKLLAAVPETGSRSLQRARALCSCAALGEYCTFFGLRSYSRSDLVGWLAESIAILRELGDAAQADLGIALMRYVFFTVEERSLNDSPLYAEMLGILRAEKLDTYLSEVIFSQRNPELGIERARANLEESLEISRRIGDLDGVSSRLHYLSMLNLSQGAYDAAAAQAYEAIEAGRKMDNQWLIRECYSTLVDIALAQGRYEEAARLAGQVFSLPGDQRTRHLTAVGLSKQMRIAWCRGDFERGRQLYAELARLSNQAVTSYQKNARVTLALICMEDGQEAEAEDLLKKALLDPGVNAPKTVATISLAFLFLRQGKWKESAILLGSADEALTLNLAGLPLRLREEYQRARECLQAALGEATFSDLFTAGRQVGE